LIIVADETLLTDPSANVLAGQEAASAVFVNMPSSSSAEVLQHLSNNTCLINHDVTERTLALLGRASALSAGLGAAAARLAGLSEESVLAAVREELAHAGVPEPEIKPNVQIAREVFQVLPQVEIQPVDRQPTGTIHQPVYQGPFCSVPSILNVGNTRLRHTGTWRVERPVIDYQRCTRCGICYVRCPDAALSLNDENYPVVDYDHCKGCMICWQQCPVKGAIRKEREVRAW
jgi:pyruvate ferredoxin oxidoreductase gamma subunit